MSKRPTSLQASIAIAPARYQGAPAAKLFWSVQGHLEDMLKLKEDCPGSDEVTIDPETDLATWSFTVYATTEEQWRVSSKNLWDLLMFMGAGE